MHRLLFSWRNVRRATHSNLKITLLSMADTALYEAKRNGRNRIHTNLPVTETIAWNLSEPVA